MHVLLTGAAGHVGQHIAPALTRDHQLRLGDVQPLADPRYVPLDVTKLASVEAALRDIDAVVHLAIAPGQEGEYEDDAFNQLRFDVNVKGTWNVLEAARRAGVRRFVFTSSLTVVWGYAPPAPVASDAPPRPVGTYAVTKRIGEVLCEHYARTFGMSIVCLRIAKPVDLDDPYRRSRPIRPQWIAFPELAEAYRLALTAPAIDFEIVTIVGDSSRRRWDLAKAERVLGYRPKTRLEDRGYTLGAENEPY